MNSLTHAFPAAELLNNLLTASLPKEFKVPQSSDNGDDLII